MPKSPRHSAAMEAVQRRRHGQTGAQVVELARRYTTKAIQKLADLMDGKAGQVTVLDKNGDIVTIDIEVPATVQAKCAEILLNRGYGAVPQAVLLGTDSPSLGLKEGERGKLTVEQKIQLLLQQKVTGITVDLEASEQSEVLTLEPGGEKPEQRAEKKVEPVVDDEVLALI